MKINLSSGNILEKPIISAFNANNTTFVVLDNESNGSMGLPIILVSKIINNNLEKIVDDNEWNIVKEYLRNIIAGNAVDYVSVPTEISAANDFYKQLTLPVASFEALKNNYKLVVKETPTAPELTPEVAQESVPTEPVISSNPTDAVVTEAASIPVAPVVESTPAAVTPAEEPVIPEAAPQVEENVPPVVNPVPAETSAKNVDYTSEKEAFMKACENMFDALVAKFNK